MKASFGTFPLSPLFLTGLVILFIANTVDEIFRNRWIFYLMVLAGVILSAIDIAKNFKNSDKKYLAELDKMRKADPSKRSNKGKP